MHASILRYLMTCDLYCRLFYSYKVLTPAALKFFVSYADALA